MEDCYDLEGEKVLLCINVRKYKPRDGRSRNRNGSEKDEDAIIKTFKERIYSQLFCLTPIRESWKKPHLSLIFGKKIHEL